MKAQNINLLKFIKTVTQFSIPVYQRKYSWEKKECDQLWVDIVRTGKENSGGHFIGPIVYVQENDLHNASLLVIDGQQRLTTLTLLITALGNTVGAREPVDGFSKKKLWHYYLINPLESGDLYYKLILSDVDRETLFSIVRERDLPEEYSSRVRENYEFFKKKLDQIDNEEIAMVCRGLEKLLIVDIALSRSEDDPQRIFESMNSTGRDLSKADLIRNFILMGLRPNRQKELYEHFWRPIEESFGQDGGFSATHFDQFIRHYLTIKTGDIPRRDQVYDVFKRYADSSGADGNDIMSFVKDIRDFVRYYCAMTLDKESDDDLRDAFSDLLILKADVVYPFLLEIYDDYSSGRLSKSEFLEAVRLVEAYVFRRVICGIPTNSLNKTFAGFTKFLQKDRYLESIKAHFSLMESYRYFPSDDDFREAIKTRNLYHFQRRSYWLRRLENCGRKENVSLDEYTIEHIMPQNVDASSAWKKALGDDWERVHQTYLHTLGNLTLTGYNAEYSNHSFKKKRDMEGGFCQSPLKLNEGLCELNEWNEDTIKARAIKLAERAIKVWRAPVISDDVLADYRSQEKEKSTYALHDHPDLIQSPIREIFDAFRREVLELDSCVSEVFLKNYVAYKAESNFVSVQSWGETLVVRLYMPFAEIIDPRSICQKIPESHRWGRADTKIKFGSLEELRYIIGLVRQSLEYQLGGNEEES